MGASARAVTAVVWRDWEPANSDRERLELAARSLPESDLGSVILATLAERGPTIREALAWIALLQRPERRRLLG